MSAPATFSSVPVRSCHPWGLHGNNYSVVERQAAAFLTLTLRNGQEARQDARAGFPTDDLEEDEAADLCTTLVEHIAQAADEDGPRMVWMARDEDVKGVLWKHGPLIDRSAR
ncbi:hypothetical protein [Streptomyces sp. NPDC005423]|uniref:hypothetical protein n=1 Tax=Streptomyces sp. NPDC005423 TaxID=3155343 RepID=UPI0033BB9319